MTDKLISCPACKSKNLDNSVYCCQCGSPMREGIPPKYPRRKGQWVSIILIALFLSVLMTLGLQLFNSCRRVQHAENQQNPATSSLAPAVVEKSLQPAARIPESQNIAASSTEIQTKGNIPKTVPITVGQVTIIAGEENPVAELPAAIISGSWVAIPARAALGGRKWLFRSGQDEPLPIEKGIWSRGDAVGFWRLAKNKTFPGPSVRAWQQENPVRLLLYQSGDLSEEMVLTPERQEGIFEYCPLPDSFGPGVFLQGDNVVGWAFGDVLQGAYMWIMPSAGDIGNTITVEDFYDETFAGGREDYFSRALAVSSNGSPRVQLQTFTEGFWYAPKLTPEETPAHLRPESVYPYIEQLVDYLMNQGNYNDIAQLADEPILREIRNGELIMNVATAIQKIYGTEAAVNFIEGPGIEIRQAIKEETPHLDRLHVDLYVQWINSLLENRDFIRGWQVFNRAKERFGDSLEIHLLGVELALAEGDWAEAESLLYQKKYPLTYRDKMMILAKRISAIKGKENQIVINFEPGSTEIPVSATLNATLDQDFLIDTGSSYVTIPYSAARTLGIEDQLNEQPQEVQTAGGPVLANVVILPSIELQGWVVNDVRALVMDLPNRPGLGLLGLNFLDRFRMDLQSDAGILILEPQ